MVVQRQVFRSFWHGSPLSPYQLLCLRSFVDRGHTVEVFTQDRELSVPDWIHQRDAQEIFPTDHVLHYQSGFGAGSPSLHSNLFRYMMLQQLGGWWIDLDVLLLRSDLPDGNFFFAPGPPPEAAHLVYSAVIKAPVGHGLFNDAVKRSTATVNADTQWGQLGPCLLTALVHEHSLMDCSSPAQSAYPVPPAELQLLFDPDRRDHVVERCRESYFIHLWNEVWRQAGIPQFMGPPVGSFMDWLFVQHDFGFKFSERIKYRDIERWIMNWKAYFEREALIRDQKANMGKLDNELSTLAARNRALETQRDELLASTSWRVTAPFRVISRSLRRVRSGNL